MIIEYLLTPEFQLIFFNYFIPWLLVISVTYGALRKTQIFEENEKSAGVIAFAIASLFIYAQSIVMESQAFISLFTYIITLILLIFVILSFISRSSQSVLGGAAHFILALVVIYSIYRIAAIIFIPRGGPVAQFIIEISQFWGSLGVGDKIFVSILFSIAVTILFKLGIPQKLYKEAKKKAAQFTIEVKPS